MAQLYNLEPPPTAKAILHTTSGSLTFELFAKQTPLASRNFLQHCLDGYYNGTIFHRLVPGFIIQGGDPTGTGSGGQSAINDGQGFDDEVHSRLKFNRRGLLGMANDEGGAGGNGSQFFVTLGATPELQGKHTMFGRIEGDTIYNLMKMADVEMAEGERSERPLYPTKITGAEVLVNPFEDMGARAREAPRVKEDSGKARVKKRKKPAGKNMMSFAAGDEEEGDVQPVAKKAKANPKLLSVDLTDEIRVVEPVEEAPATKKTAKRQRTPSPALESRSVQPPAPQPTLPTQEAMDIDSDSDSPDSKPPDTRALDKTNAEIAALKASMRRNVTAAPVEKHRPKNALEAMIPSTSTRGRKRGKMVDERGAIDMFKAFKQRLDGIPAGAPESTPTINDLSTSTPDVRSAAPDDNDDEEAAQCDLHFIVNCQSCKSWDADGADEAGADDAGEDDSAWMAHSLSFAKDVLGKDLEWKRKMAEIEVIDPREKARELGEERKREREKGKGKGRAR